MSKLKQENAGCLTGSTKVFDDLVGMITVRSPIQKKKIAKHLSKRGDVYRAEAERFARQYLGYLESRGMGPQDAVDAYLGMCADMMREQIRFMKTGAYPAVSREGLYREVYANERAMTAYMTGLAVSQFLWETHYDIFKAFKTFMSERAPLVKRYLEIGPGHGLFLNEALDVLDPDAEVHAVDISPVSTGITRSILAHAGRLPERVTLTTADALDFTAKHPFDMILLGEVLEHVTEPGRLLDKISDLLTGGGVVFVSTCANAPAKDHVYHFKSIGEIRSLLLEKGFRIVREQALPVEDLPPDKIAERKIAVNYYAVLEKERT